jgi:anthranilate synthase component 2
MILLIDNFDSFTYNVYQLVGQINPDILVMRNNAVSIKNIEKLAPSHIIISPGPGFPVTAGISIPAIRAFAGKIPILGICLGHQAIIEAFGGVIIHAPELVHGKKRSVRILTDNSGQQPICPIFRGLPENIDVARYHSLSADPNSMPDSLIVTATAPDDTIMGVMHREHAVYGVQFHPESILTEKGDIIMKNFLLCK